jgi:hypothetical protein
VVIRVLLTWNPASSEVTGETVGSVLVQIAERLEAIAIHTFDSEDGERLGELAAEPSVV